MCGLVGIYNLPQAAGVFPAMLDRIAHRGPDAGASRRFAGRGFDAILGHRRLSIIDLSEAANQPFVKDGLALVFNGEIYNYRELKAELSQHGATFRTASDTEVLLEAWRAWGPASLTRLRGMFAFALLDEQSGELVLARDHYGIKPLHYASVGEGLVFASEIKGLLAALPERRIDPTGLLATIAYGWAPDAQCVWAGVNKLPAGCWAAIAPGRPLAVKRFYDPLEDVVAGRDRNLSVADLQAVIADSVAKHMIADVPVSCFLSGGLDSSLIAAIAAAEAQGGLDAYTIGFRAEDRRLEAMPDDLKYARIVAQKFGIRLHEIEIAPDVTAMLPRIVDALDEPIGDAAAINTVMICEAARARGVKVLLSGMGADELFAGYRKHQAHLLGQRYRRLPGAMRRGLIEPIVNGLPVAIGGRGIRLARFAKRFLSFAALPDAAAFRRSYTFMGEEELPALRRDLHPLAQQLFDEHAAIYAAPQGADEVNRLCYTDAKLFMQALNLTYTDRASMAASTEVRVPFIDREVVRAAFAIPGARKIVGNERKAPLKEAALKWLPREIAYRPKGLFSAPLRAWIRRDLRQQVDDLVGAGRLVQSGWLDRTWVRRLIDENTAGRADHSHELYQLLTVETWLQQNNVTPA